MIGVLYIILMLMSLIVVFKYEKTLFSPPTIITVTWCLFPAFATFGVLGLYPISLTTHLYIIVAYISFMLSYAYHSSEQKKRINSKLRYSNTMPEYGKQNEQPDYVNYKFLIIINIIISLWLMSKLKSTLSIIQDRGFDYLRGISLQNFSESTIINIIYQWFAKPFVVASSAILSIVVFSERRKIKFLLALCVVINVLLDTFIFAARATIVKVLIYFFFSFFFCKKRQYKKKQILLIILLVIFLLMVVVYMTDERMTYSYSSFSFVDSISMYYIAPYGLLNYYVEHPEFSLLNIDGLTFGSAGFGFLYNTLRSFLYIVFKLPYNGSDYIIQLVTQQTVKVGSRVSINSACTAAYIFLRDFGIIGLIFGFSVFGSIIAVCKNKFEKTLSVREGSIYVFMLYVVFRLSMSYDFMSPSSLFVILYIYIGTYNPSILVRNKKE